MAHPWSKENIVNIESDEEVPPKKTPAATVQRPPSVSNPKEPNAPAPTEAEIIDLTSDHEAPAPKNSLRDSQKTQQTPRSTPSIHSRTTSRVESPKIGSYKSSYETPRVSHHTKERTNSLKEADGEKGSSQSSSASWSSFKVPPDPEARFPPRPEIGEKKRLAEKSPSHSRHKNLSSPLKDSRNAKDRHSTGGGIHGSQSKDSSRTKERIGSPIAERHNSRFKSPLHIREKHAPPVKENAVSQSKESPLHIREKHAPLVKENAVSQSKENAVSQSKENYVSRPKENQAPPPNDIVTEPPTLGQTTSKIPSPSKHMDDAMAKPTVVSPATAKPTVLSPTSHSNGQSKLKAGPDGIASISQEAAKARTAEGEQRSDKDQEHDRSLGSKSTSGDMLAKENLLPEGASEAHASESAPKKELYPLAQKELETLLRKHIQGCHDDHEEGVKHYLGSARMGKDGKSKATPPVTATRNQDDRTQIPAFGDMPALNISAKSGTVEQRFYFMPTKLYPKASNLNLPVMTYKPPALMPPKYANYINLESNILAKNDKKLVYLPYFNDDFDGEKNELYRDLENRFNNRTKERSPRRTLEEQAESCAPYVDKFLEEVGTSMHDILFYLLDPEHDHSLPSVAMLPPAIKAWKDRDVHCREFDRASQKWTLLFSKLYVSKPDDYQLALAGLVCAAFWKVCRFSIWHLASRSPIATEIAKNAQDRATVRDLPCIICQMSDCPRHGAYWEDRDLISDVDVGPSSQDGDSEDELRYNYRLRVIARPKAREPRLAPAYEVGIRLSQYRGLVGSTVDGDFSNPPTGNTFLPEDKLCSEDCFWKKSNRRPGSETSKWSTEDIKTLEDLYPSYCSHARGPCMIRLIMHTKPCWEIFFKMLWLSGLETPAAEPPQQPRVQPANPPKRGWSYWQRTTQTYDHEKRKPFRPCHHAGSSCQDANCRCFREKITCEPSCSCPSTCNRRFGGCSCERKGRICWQNDKCDCYRLNRECDPILCGSCGVYEVLDPANRYSEEIHQSRNYCQNAAMQRGVPKRTLMGHSDIVGWGLHAGEDIRAGEFIGEYKGEVISRAEGDRRGAVYHYRGLEYLFTINKLQDVDGTRAGNKTRFINHSKQHDNCYAKKMFCNTVQRIGLYAKTDVKAGEEFFFNYGYPDSVTKNFWDKGEKARDLELPGRKKEKAAKKQGHMSRPLARGGCGGAGAGAGSGRKKGKEVAERNGAFLTEQKKTTLLKQSLKLNGPRPESRPEMDDEGSSEEDIYEPEVGESESDTYDLPDDDINPEELADGDDEEDDVWEDRGGQRRVRWGDRRRGGEAQRRAAETRKKRKLAELDEGVY